MLGPINGMCLVLRKYLLNYFTPKNYDSKTEEGRNKIP